MMATETDSEQLARAQADLLRARAAAQLDHDQRDDARAARRAHDELARAWSAAQAERLPELRRLCHAEAVAALEADGQLLAPAIVEVAVDLRARQLLREEVDPDWAQRMRVAAQGEERTAFTQRLGGWRFPRPVIDALWTDKDPGDKLGKAALDHDSPPAAWCRDGLASGRRLLCAVGTMGTGKTFGACLAVWEWMEGRHEGVLYTTAARVFVVSDRSFSEQDRAWRTRVREADVLVLDECGGDKERKDDSADLAELLRHRFEEGRRTVLIANMSKAELAARYGDAVMSRIFEAGGLRSFDEVLRRGELRRRQLTLDIPEKKR